MRAYTLVGLFVALPVCAACSTFNDVQLAKKEIKKDASACRHASVQPISTAPTIVAGDTEFTVAIHHMLSPPADGGTPIVGFDLDEKCTGQGEGQSCRLPSWAIDQSDNPGGRDNSVTKTFYTDAGALARQAKQTVTVTEFGLITLLVRVRHYNGFPNDASVTLEFIGGTMSPSLLEQKPNPAKWDGQDAWKPLVDWTETSGGGEGGPSWTAKYTSSNAYVSDNVLVAHLDAALAATNFHFANAWLQARIVDGTANGGKWMLRDGMFGGRARIDDLLANLEYVPDSDSGLPYTCMDSSGYAQGKRNVCRAVDIRLSDDNPNAYCDAASWAWTFDADPATLANEVDFTRAEDFHKCPADTRPSNDSCATLDADAR